MSFLRYTEDLYKVFDDYMIVSTSDLVLWDDFIVSQQSQMEYFRDVAHDDHQGIVKMTPIVDGVYMVSRNTKLTFIYHVKQPL